MRETEIKLDTKDIVIGMYVTRIDRPWLESPFLLQGFLINDEDDKTLLMKNCEYCYVDVARSKVVSKHFHRSDFSTKKQSTFTGNHRKPNVTVFKRKRTYTDNTNSFEELSGVRKNYKTMTSVVKDMMKSLKYSQKLDLEATRIAIKPMVDSIIRNPDALLWLSRLRQLDDYNYAHSLGCSMWCMAMGRQLGLNRNDIESLGLGGLLFDIGKTRISETILSKTELLNDKELLIIQSHVQHSLDIIQKDNKVSVKIRSMIEHHHERVDGSGYPNGLTDQQIPLFAKIAAIADCYDAITSKRSYAEALSSQEAVKKLYEWRGKDFQVELVEEFIQAIGMFPAGSLIELTTGEVAVVVTGSRTRRLRPIIMLLLNTDKSMREDHVICNLMEVTKDEQGKSLNIKQALPAGSFGIKTDDYFL
ncbi:MAG: hypothetical protein COA74_00790 [Gammaproteobacteria bacterium]|nr:MAG: hypothetical protein COA74_00790 [Gammaproteobacteria bacterium]